MSGPINQRYSGLWLRHKLPHLAGGLNRGQHPSLLLDTESPDCLNVDFDGISVKSSRGNKKFNNQTAVRPGLLVGTRVPASLIPVFPDKSVPMMSAVYIPYNDAQDIGGVRNEVSDIFAAPADANWALQRGRNFELSVSFRLPEDFKLLGAATLGSKTAPVTNDWKTNLQGEELDEFIAIVQKGGDRLTPMSWALGLVNVGNLLDMDVGGGINGLGFSNATYRNRRSNYALCFMWLDCPQYGVDRPVRARYSLSNTKIWKDETTHISSADGRYPTFAYRAFIAPWFAEPGKNHHVSIALTLDTGSSGLPLTLEPTPSWNNNGSIKVRCCDDYEDLQEFSYDQASPGASTLIRYKGPNDSLEYFSKYGIRWWGKDPMFLGLNQRFAPWTSAGFIPFGIDAAPAENGGYALTDMSAHGSMATIYGERNTPEQPLSGFNIVQATNNYRLGINRPSPATELTGTIFEVNQRGFVLESAAMGTNPGVNWGDASGAWTGIGPQGRSPWGHLHKEWAGLGGSNLAASSGFNPEALRGYRLVLGAVSTAAGFSATSRLAAGQLLSIGTYTFATPPYGGAATQYITTEFKGFVGSVPAFTWASDTTVVGVRAFRWAQRPIVVGDLRIYSGDTGPKSYDLQHDLVSDESGMLVGHWPCDDGGDQIVREAVLQNDGYLMPLGLAKTRTGGVWLSGEGEALTLDIRDNPDLLKQVKAALADGRNGFAINMRVRIGEAYYGLTQRKEVHSRGYIGTATIAGQRIEHRMAPVLAQWSAAVPERTTYAALNQPQTADGVFSPPQPLLELSFADELEGNIVHEVAQRYPMGFSVSCPSNVDSTDWLKKVPGTGATGIHAWWLNGAVAESRWGKSGDWIGRPITIQFGFDPTDTAYQYKIYIAVYDGAEKCFWSQQTIDPREIERSIITIGGSWSCRMREKYITGSPVGYEPQGMSIWESCARMIVDSVTVYACKTPGSLPSVSGQTSPSGNGKTTHPDAINGEPSLDKLEKYPGGGTVKVTNGTWTVRSGGASFTAFADSAERSIVRIGDEKVELPDEDDLPKLVPATYYASSYVSSDAVNINRPYIGATQNGARIVITNAIAASGFDDDLTDNEFSVGSGGGYNIATSTSKDALVTDPLFGSIVDLGLGWRVRVYSNLGAGSSYLWRPSAARGPTLGQGNPIRGLYAFDGQLFAGSRGSLFEVDDRWRVDGDDIGLEFREYSDRVVCPHADISDFPQPSHGSNPADIRVWCFDARVWIPNLVGVRTIAWVGNDGLIDDAAGFVACSRWCASIVNGRPRFSIHSSDPSGGATRPYRRYNADAGSTIAAGKWVHIRWVVRGNGLGELEIPSCWIDGIPSTVSVDAVADGLTGTRPWVSGANSEFIVADELIALGAQRNIAIAGAQPTYGFSPSNTAGDPMQPNVYSGWISGLYGKLSEIQCFTTTIGDKPFDDGVAFNPLSPPVATPVQAKALFTQTPVSEVMNWTSVADGDVAATIVSHPFISLTHELGSNDSPFSFAAAERKLYVANGGRIGVIDV